MRSEALATNDPSTISFSWMTGKTTITSRSWRDVQSGFVRPVPVHVDQFAGSHASKHSCRIFKPMLVERGRRRTSET